MKPKYVIPILGVFATSCATMSESLQLGGGMGALSGATSTFVAHKSVSGESPDFGSVALGAGIGATVGLLTSYLVHRDVEQKRQSFMANETEMHFGDLPPSPFIVPRTLPKKGAR